MKRFFIFLVIGSIFAYCDKVTQPLKNPNAVSKCPMTAPVLDSNTSVISIRKVLVEDYTGHTCGNCPRAAEQATALQAQYGNKVITIANHVGIQFAKPVNDTVWREEFRNSASATWDLQFGMSASKLPNGCVNRTNSGFPQNFTNWPTLVAQSLAKPQSMKLEVRTQYDINSHYLNIKVKPTFLISGLDSVKLVIGLTQDSLVSDQTDYNPPAGAIMHPDHEDYGDCRINYRFDNLFLGSLNSEWGQDIWNSKTNSRTTIVGDTATTVYSNCNLLTQCNTANCSPLNLCFFKKQSGNCQEGINDKYVNVVVFAYRASTYEVLQVEKVKIR